jgi:thiol-disulfide isomerase/thioredoxin
MRLHVLSVLALSALLATAPSGAVFADDAATHAARLKQIETDVREAEAAFRAAWDRQTQPYPVSPGVEKLYAEYDRKREAGRAAAMDIARSDPASETGFAALALVMKDVAVYQLPDGKEAMELLAKHHAANPNVGPLVARLAYYPPRPMSANYTAAAELFGAVAKSNAHRTARGQAELGLAWQAKQRFELAEFNASKAGRAERAAADAEVNRTALEAEAALERVVKDYGDCANLRDTGGRRPTATLGEEAGRELYALRNLRPGKPAPEIAADDLDGKPFKLSDYRGKVVVLVFWASWCAPCMAAVPHERELVERYRGRPFVLVGVNGDDNKAAAARAVAQQQIPWRSFWNGPDHRGSAILNAYNVRGWPTVYVIDPRGVIAARELGEKQLDALLESLVAAAEGA